MSVLRESYCLLAFPLRTTNPNEVLHAYCQEFGCSVKNIISATVVVLYTNALRDYLERRIDGWMLESMALHFVFYQDRKVYKDIQQQQPLLAEVLFDTTDLVWLEHSEHFDGYRQILKTQLAELDHCNAVEKLDRKSVKLKETKAHKQPSRIQRE